MNEKATQPQWEAITASARELLPAPAAGAERVQALAVAGVRLAAACHLRAAAEHDPQLEQRSAALALIPATRLGRGLLELNAERRRQIARDFRLFASLLSSEADISAWVPVEPAADEPAIAAMLEDGLLLPAAGGALWQAAQAADRAREPEVAADCYCALHLAALLPAQHRSDRELGARIAARLAEISSELDA